MKFVSPSFVALILTLGAFPSAQASTIVCQSETPMVKSVLNFSSSPLRLDILNILNGREIKSVYLGEKIACGEAIESIADCELSEIWDVPVKGNYGAAFSCKSGQSGDIFFENNAIQVQCRNAAGARMQRSLTGCVIER